MLRHSSGYQKSNAGSTVGTPTMKRTTAGGSSASPLPSASNGHNTPEGLSAPELARKRQTRKDDAIRKKLDQELGRKKQATRTHGSTRPVQGTVGSLRPSAALTLVDTSMVVDAARADAVLVIDEHEHLVGIMTDKDLAFRVVAEGLDVRSTLISHVMTRNPFCVTTDTNATEALNKMVSGGFRHLPVCDEEGDVVGLLDITKCLYEALEKLDKAHQSSQKLFDALQGVQSEWSQPANAGLQDYVQQMREKMSSPDLNTILDEAHGVAEITAKTSVKEASRVMKQEHSTACLIMEGGRIAGIFTTKDIVVRVLAADLEPERTSVVRVMTPHPDTVKSSMTILAALRKMHDNRYLHLPVVDDSGHMAGLVDVLQVSFAMLNQMNSMQGESSSEGPVWNKFWESTFARDETGSEISASDVRSAATHSEMHFSGHGGNHGASQVGSGYRMDSPSAVNSGGRSGGHGSLMPAPLYEADEIGPEFTFKFKEKSGKVHRFSSSSRSFSELYAKVVEKFDFAGDDQASNMTLSYVDEETDQVLILQDSDVSDAVQMALRNQWPLIRLYVGFTSKAVATPAVSLPSSTSTAGKAGAPAMDMNPLLIGGVVGLGIGAALGLMFAFMKK